MEALPSPPETLDDVTQKLTVAAEVWSDLNARSDRSGNRDRQLMNRRDQAMEGIDLLLDRFVMLRLLDEASLA